MAAQGNPRCVALYDYQARDTEELSISKSEHLTVVDPSGSWWKVRNDRGAVGFVPSNYIKELPLLSKVSGAPPTPQGPGGIHRTPLVDEPAGMYQQTDLMRNGPSLNIKAVAKFRYVSTREDELSLEKGDSLIVIEKEADGWWRGRSGARIGWFPFNYVEELEDEPPVSQPPNPTPQEPEKKIICTVVSLYAFNSGNPEELVFQKGERMDIVDQPADDPDWWEARKKDGSTGLIPRNYVEVVHDAAPAAGPPQLPPVTGPVSSEPARGGRPVPPFMMEHWYHGRIPRKDAEAILGQLAQDGQFLVRESETKVCSGVCLCTLLSVLCTQPRSLPSM